MSDENKHNYWTLILGSVKTPLGFFTLIVLVMDGVLLGGAIVLDRIPTWAPFGLLGFICAAIFVIVLAKPFALYHPDTWPTVTVNVHIDFPVEPFEVNLDESKCDVIIKDKVGKTRKLKPNLITGRSGWIIRLPEGIDISDSVRLEFAEFSGKKWRTGPFTPYQTQVQAREA